MSSYAKQVRYALFEASDKCLLGFEAKSLGTELLEAFNFQRYIPTV